jgi:hypothetical protein
MSFDATNPTSTANDATAAVTDAKKAADTKAHMEH